MLFFEQPNTNTMRQQTRPQERRRPQSLEELRAAALNIVLIAEDIAAGADEIKRRAMSGGWQEEESAYRTLIHLWGLALPQPTDI